MLFLSPVSVFFCTKLNLFFFMFFFLIRTLEYPQAYGDIVDDLVIKMKGLGLKPREQTYRTFMFAYGK